jgi:hypothetical protein
VDVGITNALQASIGKPTIAEYDYYSNSSDTDNGIADTHGNDVFLSALGSSIAYDVVDLKVGSAMTGMLSEFAIERALQDVLASNMLPIAALVMSFGGLTWPSSYADEIGELATRGVICVASSGNSADDGTLEVPLYPAALPDVICVGSHDGAGNPSIFSQNGPAIDILADGEDMPSPGKAGTSFAAPQVAATVTHVQAIVSGLTGTLLSVAQMIDVLQQGGAGPRSQIDPADGRTRYYLHDHVGSLDYAWTHYGGTSTRALEYVASCRDLISAIGVNAFDAQRHFVRHGSVEQRTITFDGLEYIASYSDLITAFGSRRDLGSVHFIEHGLAEGRARDLFDVAQYLANYGDLEAVFGTDQEAATDHFITNGYAEGRTDEPLPNAASDFLL